VIIEAFKDQKEALSNPNPGTRQDRPAAGAQPSDPARGATPSADTGQIEHPEGGPQATSNERIAPQELQAAGSATPVPAKETPDNRPRDEPKQAAQHAPRDDKFWSKGNYVLPGEKPKEILYYLGQYLRQCRDPFDVNGLEADNATRFEAMSPNDRGEAAQMIAQRRKEIG
jgi:hypothetical protein